MDCENVKKKMDQILNWMKQKCGRKINVCLISDSSVENLELLRKQSKAKI